MLDFGQPQIGAEAPGDSSGQIFFGIGVVAENAVGAVRPELAAGFVVDQPKDKAGLRARSRIARSDD